MHKVGGEVDAFCSRCELVLAHTIHALLAGRPVKVECNTCHSVHRYRSPPGAAARRSSAGGGRSAAAPREKAEVADFQQLLAQKNQAAAQPYSPKKRFAVGDVVDHAVFGRGFVSAVRDGDKVEITFRSDVKVLVHGRS
jgi:hypothetical protein